MNALAVLTAASAVGLHVQIPMDRTAALVTMDTREMVKQVVYLKASIGNRTR